MSLLLINGNVYFLLWKRGYKQPYQLLHSEVLSHVINSTLLVFLDLPLIYFFRGYFSFFMSFSKSFFFFLCMSLGLVHTSLGSHISLGSKVSQDYVLLVAFLISLCSLSSGTHIQQYSSLCHITNGLLIKFPAVICQKRQHWGYQNFFLKNTNLAIRLSQVF